MNHFECDLNALTIHDLRKLIHRLMPHMTGKLDRHAYLEALGEETPSLVNPVLRELMGSGTLGEADAQVEMALGLRVDEAAVSPSASDNEAVKELKNMVATTQQGVRDFAESVDKRVEEVETLARRLLEHEPLRVVIEDRRAEQVKDDGVKVVHQGFAHSEFPKLLAFARAGVNILMVGPAGSGKTTAAEMLAKALGIPFHFNGAIDSEYKLKGFVDAQGRLVTTEFRKAFEHGGVYLFDEVDASLPSATMAFNAALANGWCDFPDGRVVRHPDTIIIAAANTFLGGATFEYVGRNKQDAAFVDRFVALEWNVDEALETALCPNQKWCSHVQRLRARAAAKGLKVIISPRASINGAKLLEQGLPWEVAEKAAIRKGITADQWELISK
jgi:hypothetical protein